MTVQTVRDVTDGAMLGGKYRIRRVLGQGGMGVVVEAVHVELEDRVAIKFLTPRALAEPDAVQRFVREAKAAVRLRSEHIARVRDVGLLPGGDPYIVMEYLDGVELRQLFSGPRLAPAALVDLILQACEGLAEAHAHGIVHRDIKPSNLFVVTQVDGTPLVKVLDFGVSKVPLDDLNLTGTNSWMGTPAYMSPEQMRSTRNVDARSDLWSLAVVLYEGLEGRVPFPGDSLADLCINVTSMPPQPLTDRTPAALAPVVMKGLAKAPADRFASAADLAEALAPFAETPSHADMIVRRTRRLFDRRATPASGTPAVDRASTRLQVVSAPPAEANQRTEQLRSDHAVPDGGMKVATTQTAPPSPEMIASDSAADAVDTPAASPPGDAPAADAPAVDTAAADVPVDAATSPDVDDLVEAPRRRLLPALAALAAVVVAGAVAMFAVNRCVAPAPSPDAREAPEQTQVTPTGATLDAITASDASEPVRPITSDPAAPPDAVFAATSDAAIAHPEIARDAGAHRRDGGPVGTVRRSPDARLDITPDAGVAASPVDATPAPSVDAAPPPPDADPFGRRN